MLVDPLVLKRKLNRMATEQGAFAVLSSLLLYVTELAAGDPQLCSKRTKWAEGEENKVSFNQPRPYPNRGQYPTRFQLLQSRFLNTNREPYTKKRREVGKLVIKEKLWVTRAGNKQDRCRDRKGDGKAAEEDADTAASERARRNCAIRKNTVKNILQKFLAAEEKEAKEKSPIWKKKGPNNGLPKIVSKSSVLSKLKEQFEQNTLCSAAEVKASLSHKGEKKVKNFPSRKTIRKPEVRMLRTATMTATGINSPESQYLVCSTVPVPRLSIATKINHPWSWSKNNSVKQPFGNGTPLKERGACYREPDEKITLANTARDREDKEELPVAPEATADAKDHAEAKIDSTNQGPNFNPNLDSYCTTSKNKALADCILPLSERSLDCDKHNMLAGPDTSSLLGITDAVRHLKEDSPPSIPPSSSTAERSHERNPQVTKTGEVPEITMYVYSSEEADTELTELEDDPFFAGQKCFPEQKALENILSFHSPEVQASCEVEPPTEDRQLTLTLPTPASGKRPIIVQNKAPGLRGRCSEKAKEGVKCHSEDKTSPTYSKNDNDVPTKKEEENKTPNSRMQNESKAKHPQPPQIPAPQKNFGNSNVDIPNPEANQTKSTLSSNERQPGDAEEKHISSHLEKTQSPLPSDLVKHSSLIIEEDFGKDKLSSSNEIMYDANHRGPHRSKLTDLETCHKPFKSFIEREEATADEMTWPDSEACQSTLSVSLPTPMSGIAEQRIHHTLGNPTALPPNDLVKQGAGGVRDGHASNSCEKHPPPSPDKLKNHGNNTMLEKKTACDFKNQVLPPDHVTENENSMTEETNTCQTFENCLALSTKKAGKHGNKTTLARKPLLSLEKNRTQTSDDTTKQRSDMLEENLFPLSTESVSDQKKHVKGRNKVSKHTKDKLLSSDDDTKHDNDKMETKEIQERNVLHKSEEEQAFTPRNTVDHDNNSSYKNNAHRPQIPQLPPPEHDTSIQAVKNTGQGLKHLTPSKDFVKHRDYMTVDENNCYNNGKHHAFLSNEQVKHENDSAEGKDIKSNFKNYSMPPRNTLRQNNKTTEEEDAPHNLKNEPVQHKRSCEGERDTSCDPKNLIPLSNPLVKQDKKSPPLETEKQMSPGDFVNPETKSAKKKTKQTSEKFESPSSKKVLKPQERNSSGEEGKKAPAAEDTRSPEPKAVKEDNEHHQLPPSRKSGKHEEKTPGEDKQQTRCEDFMTPNTNAAKEKNKFPNSRKYQSVSSETSVKPQEKNTPEQKQTSVSAGFKKPGTNAVKEKDAPSSKKVMKSQGKNAPGDRKQKTPAAEDTRSPEAKALKEHDKHQCSGNHQLPTPSKPSKPEKNTLGGEKQQTLSESFTKPDTSAVKHKNKYPGSEMCQSPSLSSLVKSQEQKATAKKKRLLPPSDEKTTYKTNSPKEKNGTEKRQKYQVHSSAQSEKHSNDGSGKQGPVGDFKSSQTPLPSDGINGKSNTVPKETSLFNSEKSHKPFHIASKDEGNPAGNRKKQSGFKKYQVHSSKNLVRHEKDVAEREGSWEAAGKTSEKKAELEECSKVASFPKYTVESYSERPLDSSFKPLIIRVTDTFKHHS